MSDELSDKFTGVKSIKEKSEVTSSSDESEESTVAANQLLVCPKEGCVKSYAVFCPIGKS